jgi:hypothetical protein
MAIVCAFTLLLSNSSECDIKRRDIVRVARKRRRKSATLNVLRFLLRLTHSSFVQQMTSHYIIQYWHWINCLIIFRRMRDVNKLFSLNERCENSFSSKNDDKLIIHGRFSSQHIKDMTMANIKVNVSLVKFTYSHSVALLDERMRKIYLLHTPPRYCLLFYSNKRWKNFEENFCIQKNKFFELVNEILLSAHESREVKCFESKKEISSAKGRQKVCLLKNGIFCIHCSLLPSVKLATLSKSLSLSHPPPSHHNA